jgi:hypothetical protein
MSARDSDSDDEGDRADARPSTDRESNVNADRRADLRFAHRLRLAAEARERVLASRRQGLWYPIVVGLTIAIAIGVGNVLGPMVIAWFGRHIR